MSKTLVSTVLRGLIVALGAPALVLWGTLASAHHSAAQFDFGQRVTVEGTVKEFNVTNPHTEAIVTVKDAKGTREWKFEGHSASHFYRAGYTRDMVSTGDKIAILIAPRKDGGDGGFIQAFTVNGKTVGFGGLSPETGKPLDSATSSTGSSETLSRSLALLHGRVRAIGRARLVDERRRHHRRADLDLHVVLDLHLRRPLVLAPNERHFRAGLGERGVDRSERKDRALVRRVAGPGG